MFNVGIDIGSTYTKYCVMDGNRQIQKLFSERTPVRQREYFTQKMERGGVLPIECREFRAVSCGYGRANIPGVVSLNELTALARGVEFCRPGTEYVLDIGGQDTKVIKQRKGSLVEFFLNDRCAAGSGMFLINSCNMLETSPDAIDLTDAVAPTIRLSSVCAVFAQSEIVGLVADNVPEREIIEAVIWQILTKAKPLLDKLDAGSLMLSGGMSVIPGIDRFAEKVFGISCAVDKNSNFFSAIGAALTACEVKEAT